MGVLAEPTLNSSSRTSFLARPSRLRYAPLSRCQYQFNGARVHGHGHRHDGIRLRSTLRPTLDQPGPGMTHHNQPESGRAVRTQRSPPGPVEGRQSAAELHQDLSERSRGNQCPAVLVRARRRPQESVRAGGGN
jgi:hypothetical protein